MKILITGGNGNLAKMIKNNLCLLYQINNPSRQELNILDFQQIKNHLEENQYDVLIHTAILGGRRTKEENGEVTHKNLLMFENLMKFADKFKMIINFDSAAIYDRSFDILNRKEEDIFTIPTDYYGFSKYLIYQRSLQYENLFHLRIFNIFHKNEEPDRFIKSCFFAKNDKTNVTIFNDKYFDFVYEDDFVTIVKYYLDNYLSLDKLEKTLNICYENKYKLSDIAKHIIGDESRLNILNSDLKYNYSGDSAKLIRMNLPLHGLEKSLEIYANQYNQSYM